MQGLGLGEHSKTQEEVDTWRIPKLAKRRCGRRGEAGVCQTEGGMSTQEAVQDGRSTKTDSMRWDMANQGSSQECQVSYYKNTSIDL